MIKRRKRIGVFNNSSSYFAANLYYKEGLKKRHRINKDTMPFKK